MTSSDDLSRSFTKTEMSDFSFFNQVLHRLRNHFRRNFRIDTMLVKASMTSLFSRLREASQTFPNSLRRAVQRSVNRLFVYVKGMTKFCSYENECFVSECFSNQLFIIERTVDFSRIKKMCIRSLQLPLRRRTIEARSLIGPLWCVIPMQPKPRGLTVKAASPEPSVLLSDVC